MRPCRAHDAVSHIPASDRSGGAIHTELLRSLAPALIGFPVASGEKLLALSQAGRHRLRALWLRAEIHRRLLARPRLRRYAAPLIGALGFNWADSRMAMADVRAAADADPAYRCDRIQHLIAGRDAVTPGDSELVFVLNRVRALAFFPGPTAAPRGEPSCVDTRAQMEGLLTAFLSEGRPSIMQEYVAGPDVGHASVHMYREPGTGRALAVGTVRRARVYPVGAGLGSYVVSEPLEMLIQPSLHAAEVMGLVGTMSVQWKHDERHGWRILEIGPRIALSMAGSDAWGVNIPMTAYRALCGLEVPRPQQRYGVAWIDLARDLESLREYRRRGEWSMVSWLGSLRRVRRCVSFAPDDLRPWVHQVRYHAAY